MYGKGMTNSRYSSIEREGVNAVESVFIKFGWIFREQTIVDVGIDAQVEVCENGKPSAVVSSPALNPIRDNCYG